MYPVKEEFEALRKEKKAFWVQVQIIEQAVMTAKLVQIINMKCVRHEWTENWVACFWPKTN